MTKVRESIRTPRPARRRKPSKGQQVGYVRVSSLDQNEVRQLEGLALDKTFIERAFGKEAKRPQLEAMQSFVREGDKVFCHSMNRLARNLADLRRIVLSLTERGVHIVFVKENLTFTGEDSPTSNQLLSVMGAFAEFERELIRERQREGIAIARREGKYRGRKPSLTPARVAELRRRVADGNSKAALAREFSISRDTLYRYAFPSSDSLHTIYFAAFGWVGFRAGFEETPRRASPAPTTVSPSPRSRSSSTPP
jgi:DNA invertase Pin-like site-specific DNA recombinase